MILKWNTHAKNSAPLLSFSQFYNAKLILHLNSSKNPYIESTSKLKRAERTEHKFLMSNWKYVYEATQQKIKLNIFRQGKKKIDLIFLLVSPSPVSPNITWTFSFSKIQKKSDFQKGGDISSTQNTLLRLRVVSALWLRT